MRWNNEFKHELTGPTHEEKVTAIKALFGESAHYTMKWSSNGKFTSITVRAMMLHVDEIFEKYTEASKIEGIISL